jgi:hypothetical protein
MSDDLIATPAPESAAPPATPPAPASAGHTEHEDHPWTIDIPDHPKREDSKTYIVSRKLMNAIVKAASGVMHDFFCGEATAFQDHHGGGLWVQDADGWMLLKNLAGMEWSQQFCADPAKVDQLRRVAQRLYAAFPDSIPAMQQLLGDAAAHYPLAAMLSEEIKDPDGVARWVDSIFNASVPLYAARHTGALKPNAHLPPGGLPHIEGGVHHYPTPITDIQLFKHDDFQLWVMDPQGQLAAVTPACPRGSGKGEVNVAYATPGTKLHDRWVVAHEACDHLTLEADHPMAQQAFSTQYAEIAAAAAVAGGQAVAPTATPAAGTSG